jgi:PPOX class probable F420-dependent enzyme
MELREAVETARNHHQSTLTTLRANGLPQLSNVVHAVGQDGVLRVSTTADRAKYRNLQRRPWAALKFDAGTFWSYAVIEGTVELISGAHPHWDEYRASMVADRRVVIRLTPQRAYGALG